MTCVIFTLHVNYYVISITKPGDHFSFPVSFQQPTCFTCIHDHNLSLIFPMKFDKTIPTQGHLTSFSQSFQPYHMVSGWGLFRCSSILTVMQFTYPNTLQQRQAIQRKVQ